MVLDGTVTWNFGGPNPTGLRVQLTLGNERPVATGNIPTSGEEARLIETGFNLLWRLGEQGELFKPTMARFSLHGLVQF